MQEFNIECNFDGRTNVGTHCKTQSGPLHGRKIVRTHASKDIGAMPRTFTPGQNLEEEYAIPTVHAFCEPLEGKV